jgi:hypothetical protein
MNGRRKGNEIRDSYYVFGLTTSISPIESEEFLREFAFAECEVLGEYAT